MNIVLYNSSLYNKSYEEFKQLMFDIELSYLASELLNYGFISPNEIEEAVNRAVRICKTAGLNIKKNFKPIYVYKNGDIVCDWRLSALGRKLVFLNANSDNPFVARLQIELVSNFWKF